MDGTKSSSGSSAGTHRSPTPDQGTELERGIVRTYPRVCAASFARTTPCSISVCTVWVPAISHAERSTTAFGEMIANRGGHDPKICGNSSRSLVSFDANHRRGARSCRTHIKSIEPTHQPGASGCGCDQCFHPIGPQTRRVTKMLNRARRQRCGCACVSGLPEENQHDESIPRSSGRRRHACVD